MSPTTAGMSNGRPARSAALVNIRAWRLAAAAVLSLLAGGVFAGHEHMSYVRAPVVDVEPIVRYVTVERPREECWEETVYEEYPVGGPWRVAGPTIAGGLIGGMIGHQFGSGRGRDAMTVVGTLVGSAVANERALRNAPYRTRAVPVERCEIVGERYAEERIDGYLVTYAYQGREHRIKLRHPPGDYVRLEVKFKPVRY